MTSTTQSSDIAPIADGYKRLFTDRLVARLGANAPDRQTIDLLWGMVESATWEYRQALAETSAVDVASVSERAVRLAEQCATLGLDDRRTSDVFDALANVGVCAGFIGVARDLTLVPATAG